MIQIAIIMTAVTVGMIARLIVKDITDPTMDTKIMDLKRTVADEYRITVDEMLSRSRKQPLVEARQLCHWMMKNGIIENSKRLYEIGSEFGGLDHTTVLHSVKTINDRISTELEIRDRIQRISGKMNRVCK